MDSGRYSVKPIGDSLDEFVSISGESLLASSREHCWRSVDRVGRDNIRGVFDRSRLAGGMAFYRASQWFGGRAIASGCFSAVAINPADRGSGACAAMLRAVLRELYEGAMPLAALYASTQYLYRSVGFEHAGTQTRYSIPIASIASKDRSMPAHRMEAPPLKLLNRVTDERAKRTNGNLSRTAGLWDRLLAPHDAWGTTTYLFGDADRPEGFVILKKGTRDGGVPAALVSTDLAANTPAALHRLLALVRDHRSMCDSFQWYGPPNDRLIFLASEQWTTIQESMRWMLRIVEVQSALQSRGYNRGVDGTLHFDLQDDVLPENSGRWEMTIDSGRADVRRGGKGTLRMNIRALAPLFSAFYSADQLVRLGVIESADEAQIRLATAAFSGDPAWLPEIF